MNIKWLDKKDLHAVAMQDMKPAGVLLDVGCGIVPQAYVHAQVQICCEPYAEYVARLQDVVSKNKDRQYVVINIGWGGVVENFPEKSVDTVILVDVIEHLEKEEGKRLLALTSKIARKQVIIFTPYGFMPQHHDDGKDAWGLGGGDWQEHKSGWFPEDFEGKGWSFYVAKEFHAEDSLGQRLEKTYGAFWAIQTLGEESDVGFFDREAALQKIAADLKRKENEINSYFLVRLENKIRRVLKGKR